MGAKMRLAEPFDLNTYIYSVNNDQFKTNSETYMALVDSLKYTEVMSVLIFVVASVMNVLLIVILTSTITRPLTRLSAKADEISQGSPENVENKNNPCAYTRGFKPNKRSIKKEKLVEREGDDMLPTSLSPRFLLSFYI